MEQENTVQQEQISEQQNEETSDNDTGSAAETSPNEAAPQEVESKNSHNIRVLREDKEKAQRENYELLRRLQAYENQKQEAAKKPEEPALAPDDLVEYRVVQKEIKTLRDQLLQQQQQQAAYNTELKVRSQFTDFDSVVSEENIAKLVAMEPELAASLHSNPNGYSKAVATYNALKRMNSDDKYALEKEKIAQNSTRPRSSQAAAPQQSDSPLTKAHAYGTKIDKDSKAAEWKEMQRITGRSY